MSERKAAKCLRLLLRNPHPGLLPSDGRRRICRRVGRRLAVTHILAYPGSTRGEYPLSRRTGEGRVRGHWVTVLATVTWNLSDVCPQRRRFPVSTLQEPSSRPSPIRWEKEKVQTHGSRVARGPHPGRTLISAWRIYPLPSDGRGQGEGDWTCNNDVEPTGCL